MGVLSVIKAPAKSHSIQKNKHAVLKNRFDSWKLTITYCCGNPTAYFTILMRSFRLPGVQPRPSTVWLSYFLKPDDRYRKTELLHQQNLQDSVVIRLNTLAAIFCEEGIGKLPYQLSHSLQWPCGNKTLITLYYWQ